MTKLQHSLNETEPVRFLSFGAGVQTTALLLIDSYDEVIFADTKGEMPETYEYLENVTLPYAKQHGIKFTVLSDPVQEKGTEFSTASLEEWCLHRKITPSRIQRWCTDRFKIRRIRAYIKSIGASPAIAVMGISADEIERMHKPHWSEYTFEYPLIDKGLTREDCRKIITEHGLPIPPKSGCYYCPFARRSQFVKLYYEHPDLFKRAQAIEEGSPRYPKYNLAGRKSLAELARSLGDGSRKLTDFDDDPKECESGFCMV